MIEIQDNNTYTLALYMIATDDKKVAAEIQVAVTVPSEATTKETESTIETKEYSICRSNDLHENEY